MQSKYFLLLLITLLVSACSNNNVKVVSQNAEEAYTLLLESLMNEEESLNNDIEYVSIDLSNINGLREEQKQIVKTFFKSPDEVEVLDLTLDELREENLFDADSNTLTGILLTIEEINFYQDAEFANFKGSKYRSDEDVVTVEGKMQYTDGQWELIEIKQTSES
ncbi:peptide ABC transporter substrate-binding protein [Paenisporosarcina sp. FSL H8-0542]|uniref:peptide ABC transporter substrate-binding protein n=1 Tax=Paenisporosarcina sp. FSL H8-0542 TaxID=2921401 RepID=UPI00315B2115